MGSRQKNLEEQGLGRKDELSQAMQVEGTMGQQDQNRDANAGEQF